ncbi:MAG: hypothetical protein L0G23_09730 [Ruaniaceae bacterium]|nr:hypothetical protein [Ruaniaceae bacterium]
MPAFVIEYDRRTGESTVHSFTGSDGHRAAIMKRFELERARSSEEVEIVSLVSDSLETIKRTHSRYFMQSFAMAED